MSEALHTVVVEHVHTIRVNGVTVAKREGPVITVVGHSVQLMNAHEAGYLMSAVEQLITSLTT